MRASWMVVGLGVASATLVAGCGTPEFRPLDEDRGVRPELAAAQYDIELEGRDVGDAKVWSNGPPRKEDVQGLPGDPAGLVQVGVRVRNDGREPLRLDVGNAQLEVRTEDDRLFVLDRPVQVVGSGDVPPRTTERVELTFALPPKVTVADLVGYELLWSVETADGGRVSYSTPFTRQRSRDYPGYYYRPYYYPYYYPYYHGFGGFGPDPWGWSYGVGGGFGW